MNESPKPFWQRVAPKPLTYAVFFAAMVGMIFYVILYIGVPESLKHVLAPITFALFVAVAVTVAGIILFHLVRWLRHWRNLRWVLFVIVCLLTLLALLVTEENWRGHRDWENFRHALEAKGETYSLMELAPRPVPDDQNLAFTPLLKPLFDFIGTNTVSWEADNDIATRRDTNAFAHLRNVSAYLRPPDSTNYGPDMGNLITGSFLDLAACQAFYRGNTNYPQAQPTDPPAEVIRLALSQFDRDIAELRAAASARPYTRFPINYDVEPPTSMLFPHLLTMKGLGMLLNLRIVTELELGRTEEAFNDLKLSFRLADGLREEPLLISHLVRLAMLSVHLQAVREGLVRHAWTDAQLIELDHYLAAINLTAEWKHAMRGERAFSANGWEYMRTHGVVYPEAPQNGWPLLHRTASIVLSSFYYQNMLSVSELQEKYVMPSMDENARRVYPGLMEDLTKHVQLIHDHPLQHPHEIIAATLLPAVTRAASRTARGQSYLDAARVAMALERFQRANGHLPDSIDALAPQFIDKIPSDVMDGQPLRYRKTGDKTFVVYSIGWNLKDDGGVLGRKPEGKGLETLLGDWVWFSTTNKFEMKL